MNKALGLLLMLLLSACSSLPEKQKLDVQAFAQSLQDQQLTCNQPTHCAIESPLYNLANTSHARSTASQPQHSIIMLDQGHDALLTRLHMIESAKQTIEMQVYIFELDESGTLVLDALIRAARRGVKVRVLLDQLNGLTRPDLQAKLAVLHLNFELKVYSPIFNQSKLSNSEFFASIIFDFDGLNQRMHTKLLLVDDKMAVVGGRNIQDSYFDWDADYNFRDRDVWVAGPVNHKMRENFDAFWTSERSIYVAELDDVGLELQSAMSNPDSLHWISRAYSERMQAIAQMAKNSPKVLMQIQPYLDHVGYVGFYADLPDKHKLDDSSRARAANAVYQIITEAKYSVILQTPYLVMSRMARQAFRTLQKRGQPVRVWVSTNSLAATDAFPPYALSHKYKRLYIKELGFHIYEFKPFPQSVPMRVGQSVGWVNQDEPNTANIPRVFAYTGSGTSAPVPLTKTGARAGLHAKSMVIDGHLAVIGSHNFDPRSDDYNTESLLLVDDKAFAEQLSASIRNDMQPDNAWIIAPRETLSGLAEFNYTMGKLSEQLSVFDIWPWPYATSYQLNPECWAITPEDPRFSDCSQAVGDFPEVNMSLKAIYTRIITAFGAGFEPIL